MRGEPDCLSCRLESFELGDPALERLQDADRLHVGLVAALVAVGARVRRDVGDDHRADRKQRESEPTAPEDRAT